MKFTKEEKEWILCGLEALEEQGYYASVESSFQEKRHREEILKLIEKIKKMEV